MLPRGDPGLAILTLMLDAGRRMVGEDDLCYGTDAGLFPNPLRPICALRFILALGLSSVTDGQDWAPTSARQAPAVSSAVRAPP